MSDVKNDFEGVVPDYTPLTSVTPGTTSLSDTTPNAPSGLIAPPAFLSVGVPMYTPAGGGGGGGVTSVSGTAGQIIVSNGTSTPVIGLAPAGTAITTANPASITTDGFGRVTASTSLGYTPANPANFVPVTGGAFTGIVSGITPTADANLATKGYVDSNFVPKTGGAFTGLVSGITPTADANFTTKQYVDSQIVIGGGVQSLTAADSSITLTGTPANPIIAVSNQAGVTPGAYTNANVTVDAKGIVTAVSNGSAPGDVSQWATFPAVQDIDVDQHAILNCVTLSAPINQGIDIVGSDVNIRKTASLEEASIMNIVSDVGIDIRAGGAVLVNAGGAVEIGAAGTIQILSTGNVSIGSGNVLGADTEIEHISFKDNVISKYSTLLPSNPDIIIEDVDTINTVKFSSTGDIETTASITAPFLNAGTQANFTTISLADSYSGVRIINSETPVVGGGGIVDTNYNPANLNISGSTLSVKAKNGSGVDTTMSSVDLSVLQLFNKFPAEISQNFGTTKTLLASEAGSIFTFKVTQDSVLPLPSDFLQVNLPNGPSVVNGSAFFIKNASDSVTPVKVVVPTGKPFKIAASGGIIFIARNTTAGTTDYAATDSLNYIPLEGTAVDAPITGALNFDATDSSIALNSKYINTEDISVLAPGSSININSLAQTRELLVRPEVGGTNSILNLATSIDAIPAERATIEYDHALDDIVHFNKVVDAPDVIVGGEHVLPLITFKDAQTFYVSKSGSDSNDGSVLAPFLTVQAAVTAAVSTGSEAVVDVGPGTFTENISIASIAGVMIRGCMQSDRMIEGTILKGVISIVVTGTDNLNNNQVVINGCFVMGHIHDTSSKQHTLIIDGCRIEGDNSNGGRAIQIDMTSTTGRTFVSNCVITQEAGTTGTNPLISINRGWLDLNQVQATVRAEGYAVSVNGDALLTRMVNTTLTSDSASSNPDPLVFLNSTTATPHNMALCSFVYSSSTSKTTPAILATRPTPGVITAVIANCIFGIGGTLAAGNVIQYSVGTALVLLVGSNRSLNTAAAAYASNIQSGVTVLPLTRVGETSVSTVNSLSGAVTLAAGSGISVTPAGNTLTIANTRTGVVESVTSGGAGISVTGTTANPVINNTGVTQLIAGSNISLTASTGSITISASGGGGGGGNVDTVSAGTGITLTGTAQDVIVNNAGVLSVGTGVGLTNTGTASDPVIEIAPAGTITFDVVNSNDIQTTDLSSTNFPTVPGSSLPTDARQLVPKVYVDNVNTGVLSVTAGDSSINVGGTPTNVTLTVGTSGVTGGSYTNSSITVGADGRVTAASSGTAPVTSVSGAPGQIDIEGGITTPTVSLALAGTSGVYTYPSSVTTDLHGRVTAITSGTQPITEVSAGTGISVSGTPGSVTITNDGVLSVTASDSSVTVGGTSTDPSISLPNQTITPGAYTWGAITVDQKGIITAISENNVPFTEVSAGTGISVSGTPGSVTITNDGVTALNSKTGSVSLLGGTNVTVDDTVPGQITINASGGGGGGIASINSETGPAITIAAGSGISVGTAANTITITNTGGGGGGGVQSVSIVPGGGLILDDTDPANPILNNGGVVSLQSFQGNSGNIEIDNLDGFIGVSTIPDPIPGSVQKIRLAYNALNNIQATNGSIILTGTTGVRSIEAKTGGTAYTNIDMINLYALTRASKLNVNGPLSFLDIGGFTNGYEMTGNDAGAEVGITRNQIDTTETVVPGTKALMFDEIVYAPTSPFNPSSGFTPGPGGLFVSGTAKLIASQLITLTQANFPYANQAKYVGVSGTISFIISAAQPLSYLVRYRKNGGTLTNASGGVYYTSTQSISVPVSGITWTGGGGNTFKVGDTITWEIYATYTGATPPSVVTAPTVFSAVFSPLAV